MKMKLNALERPDVPKSVAGGESDMDMMTGSDENKNWKNLIVRLLPRLLQFLAFRFKILNLRLTRSRCQGRKHEL